LCRLVRRTTSAKYIAKIIITVNALIYIPPINSILIIVSMVVILKITLKRVDNIGVAGNPIVQDSHIGEEKTDISS